MTIVAPARPADLGLTELHGFDRQASIDHADLLGEFYRQYAALKRLVLYGKITLPKPIAMETKRIRSGNFRIPHWYLGRDERNGHDTPYRQYFVRDDGELVFALTIGDEVATNEVTQYLHVEALSYNELLLLMEMMYEFRYQHL